MRLFVRREQDCAVAAAAAIHTSTAQKREEAKISLWWRKKFQTFKQAFVPFGNPKQTCRICFFFFIWSSSVFFLHFFFIASLLLRHLLIIVVVTEHWTHYFTCIQNVFSSFSRRTCDGCVRTWNESRKKKRANANAILRHVISKFETVKNTSQDDYRKKKENTNLQSLSRRGYAQNIKRKQISSIVIVGDRLRRFHNNCNTGMENTRNHWAFCM